MSFTLPTHSGVKLAFLISSFRSGGGEKQMVEIANAFAARGQSIDLLVLKPVGDLTAHVDRRVRVISLDRKRIALSFFPLLSYLRREHPAAVLSVDEYTHVLALLARPLASPQTRVVLRLGNMLSELSKRYEGRNVLLPFFVRRLFKRADMIIANSQGVRDDALTATGIDPEKVTVIFNPKSREDITRKAAEPSDSEWLERKTLPVVLFAGRLRVQKNLPSLIRAFSIVLKKIPSRLIILGMGREEKHLRTLIEELHCEDAVILPGFSGNPYAWMSKADVFVYPSLWEGMPNALIEAMICGTPVISSDCASGPREILAPDTDYKKRLASGVEYAAYGVLFAVNDEEALVEALNKLLTDEALRKKYAQASLARAKDFDAEDIIDEYARVLGV